MKTLVLLFLICVPVCGQVAEERQLFHSARVIPSSELALLERMSNDSSFTKVDYEDGDLISLNALKLRFYSAYENRSPEVIKLFAESHFGWEGQYTKTWFTLDRGTLKVVEAYFGDPSASGDLQYVREYTSAGLVLGRFNEDRELVQLSGQVLKPYWVLYIAYCKPGSKYYSRF